MQRVEKLDGKKRRKKKREKEEAKEQKSVAKGEKGENGGEKKFARARRYGCKKVKMKKEIGASGEKPMKKGLKHRFDGCLNSILILLSH